VTVSSVVSSFSASPSSLIYGLLNPPVAIYSAAVRMMI
jgi:hypothetical protein